MDHRNSRIIVWVTGGREAVTFKRLFEKVKHLKHCIFYTDDWGPFAKVVPKNQHVSRKKETVTAERDNSNTRHHLGCMIRPTKIVSKKEEIVCGSIKLWCALTIPEIFSQYQAAF